jgi:hypothetical protein
MWYSRCQNLNVTEYFKLFQSYYLQVNCILTAVNVDSCLQRSIINLIVLTLFWMDVALVTKRFIVPLSCLAEGLAMKSAKRSSFRTFTLKAHFMGAKLECHHESSLMVGGAGEDGPPEGDGAPSRPFALTAEQVFQNCREIGTTDLCWQCPEDMHRACNGLSLLTPPWNSD